MAWVYILKGSSGRHYIGSTANLAGRLAQHSPGHTHTTKRLGDLVLITERESATLAEARKVERLLEAKKNPTLAIFHLQQ